MAVIEPLAQAGIFLYFDIDTCLSPGCSEQQQASDQFAFEQLSARKSGIQCVPLLEEGHTCQEKQYSLDKHCSAYMTLG